jgi:hypothetical protein
VQLEVLFLVGTLLGERSCAETNFHPPGCSVVIKAGAFHIMEVFVTRNGAASKGAVADCIQEILLPSRFDSCFNEISHQPTIRILGFVRTAA